MERRGGEGEAGGGGRGGGGGGGEEGGGGGGGEGRGGEGEKLLCTLAECVKCLHAVELIC